MNLVREVRSEGETKMALVRGASRKAKLACLLAVVMLSTFLPGVALDAPSATAQATCPAGSSPNLVTWGAAGGINWFRTDANGTSRTYPDIGGSGVDMTMTLTDPSGMNEDTSNVLINLPTADLNWDPPLYTETDGAYGPGFLTFTMTSLNSNQVVTMDLAFTAPVLIPDFSIGDIDFVGNTSVVPSPPFPPGSTNAIPHDSFQDEILLSAHRSGTPVGFSGVAQGGSSPVVTLNDAANGQFAVAGGPYASSVFGNLNPGDAGGTVVLSTLAPVTGISFGYSNGPDDEADDITQLALAGGTWPAANFFPPMLNTDVGVSNNHAVRVNVFTICTGDMSIGDRVWTDYDGDGVQDPGEPGIENATVTLRGEDGLVLDTVTTDANGEYEFPDLPPWTYTVEVSDLPPDLTPTFDRDTGTTTPDLNSGDIVLTGTSVDDADFGLQPPLGSISGTVFADVDNDGVQNAGVGDTPIANATVTLTGTDLSGNVYNVPTTTDANGDYSFPDLPPGNYTVTESQPAGFDDGIDTPGNLATGAGNDTFNVVLGAGDDSADNDFAELADSSVAGTVFRDDNNDGEINGTDMGIGGVTVTLIGTDNAGNAVSRTATTNPDGTYLFDNLRDGTYTVQEAQPLGFFDGIDDAGTIGGDDTSVNDEISGIVLPTGTDATEYDFGEIAASSIAGSVYDQDNMPIPDTAIDLMGTDDLGNPVTLSTTTDPNGDYSFADLRPGIYTVTETQPTGFGDGPDFVGSEGGNDTVNDEFSAITLPPGIDAIDYDFTETTSAISGSVVDDGGIGIPNVTLNLTGTNASGDPVSLTTTTDANGDYSFTMLQSGTYTVEEIQPLAYGDGDETAGSEGGDISTNDFIADIVLPAGTESIDNDFAEIRGSIAGSVFEDTNNNGVQDGAEVGIGGVTVDLSGTDVNGAPVTASVTTEPDGTYLFPDLLAGDYTINETQPVTHVDGIDTAGTAGGDDATVNDEISGIALDGGEDATDYDFGELLASSISGTVFEDPNNNGVQEFGEDGIGGVPVALSGVDDLGNPVTASTTTNPDGTYSFTGLRPGTYVVNESQPAGYEDGIDTAGSEGGLDTVNDEISAIVLGTGVDAVDYDFAEIPPSSISGSVVDDFGNPIPNVQLDLSGTDDLGNPVTATTTTDPNGDYVFPDLRPGTYTVTETQPPGYADGPDTAGSTGGDVSTNDVIADIPLGPAEDSVDNDFEETTGSIAGTVFEDTNNNGVQDGVEPGIENVTVELSGTDVNGNPVTASTTTGPDGTYLFEGLPGGTYTVTETQPLPYFDGIDTPGSEGGDASTNDVIDAVVLGDGVDATDYDFGELPPSSISGSVVDDLDNPIPNVTLELSGTDDLGNPVTATTTTDPNGDYVFPDLRPGDYTVTETQPPGYGDGPETAGSTGGDVSTNDIIADIPLGADENSLDNDFVETTSSIAGSVFEDDNNDGQFDLGETPIEGVEIVLAGTDVNGTPVVATTTTAADGSYLFDGLLEGTYAVTETQPLTHIDGMHDAGSEGGDDSVDDIISAIPLGAGVDAVEYDFGEIQLSSISGTVFEDTNNDGVQDPGEDGIENVTVELSGTDDLGNPVTASTTTNPDGTYTFPGLRPGDYTVTETQPTGYLDGIDTPGSEGGDDTVNDEISSITLLPFTDAVDYDFAEIPPASISGSVVDDFGNPIPNVQLDLSGTDDLGNPVTATTTTDPNGDYVFPDLRPGDYTVTETQPPGYGDGPETAGSTGGDTSVNDEISSIPLAPGDDSVDNDFEETTGSIAGTVFEDTNNNGVQDGVEPGIENVTVELSGTDVNGNPVTASTTTGPDGTYLFEGLAGGTYTVTETQPPFFLDGIDTAGSEGGDDATVNDEISSITLPDGVDATDYDFGEIPPASISGSVVDDLGNPIPNVQLDLSGTDDLGNPVTATTTTDPNGDYLFPDLRPGDYTVTETQPPGYGDGPETAGSTGGDTSVNDAISSIPLTPGDNSLDNDFEETTSSVSGSVFEDLNNDGQFDVGETPIEGVEIVLAGTDVNGTPVVATTATAADGSYEFDGLLEGTYAVTETQPLTHIDGMDDAGSEGGDDSVDDIISAIPLGAGVDAVEYDFGEIQLSSISGTVFEDTNNDGVQDPGEDGIENVTVELSGTDDLGNPVTASTTTNPDGTYTFPGLRPGDYTVTETQPAGYLDGIDTPGSEGGDDTVNDEISSITLLPFTDAVDYDFAEIPPASISGSVVDDFDNPIEGVTVELSGTDDLGNPVTATTTTDPNGDYSFPDLRPGGYTVTETQPPGYGDGPETAGSTGGDTSVNDEISSIPLTPGDDSVDNDFEETTSSIAGTVFEDNDNNGVREPGEAGIEGVTVELSGTDVNGDPVTATTTTGPDGTYVFDMLLSGDYTVSETQPADYFDGADLPGSEGGDASVDDVISSIALPIATEATDYDFGEVTPSDISGTVEEDTTGDGVPDGPLEGVTVELVDDQGDVVATTTTDPNGDFLFEDVPPGEYIVRETDPVDYDSVSDVEGPNDNEIPVTMAGEDIVDRDFVDEPLADISGTVEEDTTGDGVPDGPLEGVTVELVDDQGDVVATTTTDPNGDFLFEDVPPGEYIVRETDPVDYDSVSDVEGPNDNEIPVTMTGEDIVDRDFVDEPLADISGTVEEDTTGDGVPDGPLEGVTVELVDDQGDVVATTTTDPNGDFLFEDVPPGEYIVRETDPVDYDSVSDVEGPNDNEIPVTMTGEDIVDRDFVDEPLADISGTVEEDIDQDGTPDEPLEGVIVELVDDQGDVVATTTTDPNGDFLFEDVPPGEYIVRETDPAAYRSVSDVEGPNDNEIPVTMTGEDIVDRDFVDEPLPSSVSGNVRSDTDDDGEPNEPLEGVEVQLIDEDGEVIDTTTTGPDGSYGFTEVPPGTYTLVEVDPDDYDSVSDIDGPNDNTIEVTVANGDPVTDQDFLDEPLASITGVVEEDRDHDGLPDCASLQAADSFTLSTQEPALCPLADVVVELVDGEGNVVATTTTDPDGRYGFDDVPPGDYVVREIDPDDYTSISDVEGENDNEIPVTMTGEDVNDRNFTDGPVFELTGVVMVDNNGDGVGDRPIPDVVIQLTTGTGDLLAETTTGPDGSYVFEDLPPGEYIITEVDPAGHQSVSDNDGANDNVIRATIVDESITDLEHVDRVPVSVGLPRPEPLPEGFFGNPAPTPAATTEDVPPVLALTGRSIAQSVLIGVLMIVLGLVFVATTRRKSESDEE